MRSRIFLPLLLTVLLLAMGSADPGSQPPPLLSEGRHFEPPFEPGEKLRYEINWKPLFLIPALKAGELTLQVQRSTYRRQPSYRLSAEAVSDGMLSRVSGVEIRNFYESIVDGLDFRSYRILKQTRQNNRKRDMDIRFEYAEGRVLLRELNLEENPPEVLRDEEVSGLNGPVSDVLSVFYVTRLRPFRQGDQFLIHLADDGDTRNVPVRVEGYERVRTGIGRFDAIKLTTVGGLFRGGGDFSIWYSRDDLRIPLRFEADVRFGKVYGHLIQMETGSVTRGRIRVN